MSTQRYKKMIEDDTSISVMKKLIKSGEPRDRADAAIRLSKVHKRIREAINMVVSLLDDPDERVAKQAYHSLMINLNRMNGRTLTRIDKILKLRAELTITTDPHVTYIGSINTRGHKSISVLLFYDDEESLWFKKLGEDYTSLAKLNSGSIERDYMLLGNNDGNITTTTVDSDIYAILPVLMVLEDL